MVSRPDTLVRAFLLVELILLTTRPARALETNARVEELKFKFNEWFMRNRKPCPIVTTRINFEFPKEVERVLVRSYIANLNGSRDRLRTINGVIGKDFMNRVRAERAVEEIAKKDQTWFRKWRKEFLKKQNELISKGKGMSLCIIWGNKERRSCCEKFLEAEAPGTLRDFKFKYCMNLVKTFVHMLLQTGVILREDDEEKLEDQLNRILAEMARERRAQRRSSVSLTPLYEVGIDSAAPKKDRFPLTEGEEQQMAGESQLVEFLTAMKQIEYLFLTGKQGHVITEHQAIYSTFMDTFQGCMTDKKAAVSYHTAEIRWTTCGPVSHGSYVAGYCADLAALDPEAPELGRKPILKWESGAYEHTHNLLGLGNFNTVVDDDDGEGEVERINVGDGRHGYLRRAVRAQYRDVDLFQVELERSNSFCKGADMAHPCYAICCDTAYESSYFCQTAGVKCIG